MSKKLFAFSPSQLAFMENYSNSLSDDGFKCAAKADDDGVELLLDGIVGDYWEEMDSRSIAAFLAKHGGKPVHVRMNSPGGLVFDGIAIYSALLAHDGPVTGTIESLAASAMTIVSQACDTLRIAGNGMFMVHRAWGVAIGNRDEMDDMKDVLDKIDANLIATYAARTGLGEKELNKLMKGKSDGTWLTANEALEKGFVDEVLSLQGEESEEHINALKATASEKIAEEKRRITAKAVQVRLRTLEVGS